MLHASDSVEHIASTLMDSTAKTISITLVRWHGRGHGHSNLSTILGGVVILRWLKLSIERFTDRRRLRLRWGITDLHRLH